MCNLRNVLILVCFFINGCKPEESQHQSVEENQYLSVEEGQIVVLVDRFDPVRQVVYVFHAEGVFVSDHIFPGYTDQQYYLVDFPTIESKQGWEVFDELDPPFEPSGPNGFCYYLSSDGLETKSMYFDDFDEDHDQDMKVLESIRQFVNLNKKKTDQIPTWVKSQPRLSVYVKVVD